MADERRGDGVLDLWHTQHTEGFRMTSEQMRTRSEQMERRLRRMTWDYWLASVLIAIVIGGMTALAPSPLQIAGAALAILGGGFLAYEVGQIRIRRSAAIDAAGDPAIAFQRAQLRRQLEFARKGRVWRRVILLAPGPLLFFFGFARAHPNLAPIMYVQMLTFVVVAAAIVPLGLRMRRRIEQQLAELDQLEA